MTFNQSQTFFGGADLEQGTGISVVSSVSVSSIYLSGVFPSTISPLGYEGIALNYTLNSGSFTPQFQWNRSYPGVAGEDQFAGVTANASGAFFGGYSFSRTTDTVGDKEIKGIVVNIPSTASERPGNAKRLVPWGIQLWWIRAVERDLRWLEEYSVCSLCGR